MHTRLYTTGLMIVAAFFILSSCSVCILGFPTSAAAATNYSDSANSVNIVECSNQPDSHNDVRLVNGVEPLVHSNSCALAFSPNVIQTSDAINLIKASSIFFANADSIGPSLVSGLYSAGEVVAVNPSRQDVVAYTGTTFKRE